MRADRRSALLASPMGAQRGAIRRAAGPCVEQILVASIEAAVPSSHRSGILLSGGIDSVCLAALASQQTDAELTGFTFDYSDYEGKFNEAEVAGSIADRLGIAHEMIPIDSECVIDQFSQSRRPV